MTMIASRALCIAWASGLEFDTRMGHGRGKRTRHGGVVQGVRSIPLCICSLFSVLLLLLYINVSPSLERFLRKGGCFEFLLV